MRAASPPASASDLIEQQQKRARREHKVGTASSTIISRTLATQYNPSFLYYPLPLEISNTHVLCKLSRLLLSQALIKQDNLDAFNEKDPYKPDDSRDDDEDNDDNDNSMEAETFPLERDEVMPLPIPHLPAERVSLPKGLPWAPKVR